MEKKETSSTNSLGVCEKLFNSFTPSFRPLRRLTFRRQDIETTTDPPPATNSAPKDPSPIRQPPPPPQHVEAENHHIPQKPSIMEAVPKVTPTPTKPEVDLSMAKKTVEEKISSAPPPLKPALKQPRVATSEKKAKKSIDDKANEYLNRARAKIRSTGSNVGRTT